ncbi:max-binding protein MNT-like [Cyprinus carpio]|uniref:Max-binding protein MNT n=1 Tax=Cyprinus carpio TaxID=7962 RepID=A0A8C1Q9F2_CYPCA|nr:max-binding protein MNT-like [Cyprinus carpio]
MSIETLLEAAKFLELQALQQQKAREENELQERRRREQEAEKRRAEVNSYTQPIRMNHVTWVEESGPDHRHIPVPAQPPPPPPPPTMPITVIPISVVSSTPPALPPPPITALSPSAAPPLTPPRKDTHSLPNQQALHQRPLISSQVKAEPTSLSQSNGTKPAQQLQTYPGPIVTASQHALLPQPGPPSAQSSPAVRGSPPDDHRNFDGKKRPGGAGTREVHNKLEKNRRAHLKECFETLKKNIPNVDEKKTSNLSVLRSALRYIQTLKRKEKDYEHEMERLAREKIALQQRLAELKNELSQRLDVIEIDRVLRQTVQPDDDQASTSTASEGEDNIDEDIEDEMPSALPKVPAALQQDLKKSRPVSSLITQHIHIPHNPSKTLPPIPSAQLSPIAAAAPITAPALTSTPASAPAAQVVTPQTLPPAQTHIVTAASLQPSVIAHAGSASHASVIQTVNRVIQPGSKHVAHIAPSSSSSVQLAPGPQSISHITVAHLPPIYPQPVTVTQPAVMSHIAQTLSHSQMNGTSVTNAQAKQMPVGAQMVTHHPQLVGQTVLNPVTMVTMPSFPVSTLKLA